MKRNWKKILRCPIFGFIWVLVIEVAFNPSIVSAIGGSNDKIYNILLLLVNPAIVFLLIILFKSEDEEENLWN